MIYLGQPYSDPDPDVQAQRYEQAAAFLAQKLSEGHYIYAPIVMCHPVAQTYDLPKGFTFWRGFDLHMVFRADELWVLLLPGWSTSVGLAAEINAANTFRVPVKYFDPKGDQVAFINLDAFKD